MSADDTSCPQCGHSWKAHYGRNGGERCAYTKFGLDCGCRRKNPDIESEDRRAAALWNSYIRDIADLFDVVIFEIETRIVDTIAGERMVARKAGYGESAERRVQTVQPRLNDRYAVVAVPAGAYAVGDVMDNHETNE